MADVKSDISLVDIVANVVIVNIMSVIINCIFSMFVIGPAFSKHYRKVGQSICGLARSFELDERPGAFVTAICVCPFQLRLCHGYV